MVKEEGPRKGSPQPPVTTIRELRRAVPMLLANSNTAYTRPRSGLNDINTHDGRSSNAEWDAVAKIMECCEDAGGLRYACCQRGGRQPHDPAGC